MILITGAAGYIGSHLALKLLEKNEEIIVFDNLSTGHIETIEALKKVKDFEFIKGDLKNFSDINNVLKSHKIDAIFHFAAFSQVNESVKNPAKYYENNVIGSINLLNAMKENKVDKIIFSSTAATYGEPKYIPIDEKHPQNPINPYGSTKLMIERIMDDYDKAYNIKSVRLRYFNVVGADEFARVGEWHDIETHLVPNILKSLFKKEQTFKIFGDDYDTKDGTCIRDYINVEDLAMAHILAYEYLKKTNKTAYFNLGTNEGNSVKEIFETCKDVTGQNIPYEIEKRRQGDPKILVADNKKAKEILNWHYKKSLNESIKSAYIWEEKLNKLI